MHAVIFFIEWLKPTFPRIPTCEMKHTVPFSLAHAYTSMSVKMERKFSLWLETLGEARKKPQSGHLAKLRFKKYFFYI